MNYEPTFPHNCSDSNSVRTDTLQSAIGKVGLQIDGW